MAYVSDMVLFWRDADFRHIMRFVLALSWCDGLLVWLGLLHKGLGSRSWVVRNLRRHRETQSRLKREHERRAGKE